MAEDTNTLNYQINRVVGGHNNTLRAILKLFGITNADTLKADAMSATVGNIKVPIKNGGTGKASMTDHLIHYGQFSQLSRPANADSVLSQGSTGQPYWIAPGSEAAQKLRIFDSVFKNTAAKTWTGGGGFAWNAPTDTASTVTAVRSSSYNSATKPVAGGYLEYDLDTSAISGAKAGVTLTVPRFNTNADCGYIYNIRLTVKINGVSYVIGETGASESNFDNIFGAEQSIPTITGRCLYPGDTVTIRWDIVSDGKSTSLTCYVPGIPTVGDAASRVFRCFSY